MKIFVDTNNTPWTDKSIESFVRAAIRGRNPQVTGLARSGGDQNVIRVHAESRDEDTTACALVMPGKLVLNIPATRALETLGDVLTTRPTLPSRICATLFDSVREALLPDPKLRRDKRTAPALFGRRRSPSKPKPTTKLGRAKLKLADAERRVKKYEALAKRARRQVRARKAIVTMFEARGETT